MNPITHGLIGWTVAAGISTEKRDRALITLAGIIPDFDGMGIVADWLKHDPEQPLYYWSAYHHVLGHNLGMALIVIAISTWLGKRRRQVLFLTAISFHLHLLGDILGGRGPDGYQWPIPYLLPFSDAWQITWAGQWTLNAWPNILITVCLLMWMFYTARQKGFSPLELLSPQADRKLVSALHSRFGNPAVTGKA